MHLRASPNKYMEDNDFQRKETKKYNDMMQVCKSHGKIKVCRPFVNFQILKNPLASFPSFRLNFHMLIRSSLLNLF